MGFRSAVGALFRGDFRDSFNYALTSEDEIQTQKLIANAQEKMIQDRYNKGLIDEQKAGELMNLSAGSAHPFLWRNEPGGDPAKVFADTIKAETGKVFEDPFGTIVKKLPLWLWVLLALGAAIYFWPLIRGALAFRAKFK